MLSTGTKPREMAIDLFHFLSSSCRSTILPPSTPDNLQNKYNISFITNKKYIDNRCYVTTILLFVQDDSKFLWPECLPFTQYCTILLLLMMFLPFISLCL